MSHGKLIVFTGPSAVGKATVEKYLFEKPNLKLGFSISATTRQPRPNEKDGEHYHFIDLDQFNKMIVKGEFIEFSEHFDNKYGTLKSEVDRIVGQGNNAFLEIEPNGARQVINRQQELKLDLITIFLAPPSMESLEKRIRNRATETEEQIQTRLARAEEEISHASIFQCTVINDDPKRAADEIADFILKEVK